MNKTIMKLVQPGMRMYLFVLVIFAVSSLFFDQRLAIAEGFILLLLIIYSVVDAKRRRKSLTEYIESITYDVELAKNNTLINFPLPMVAFKAHNLQIIWGNQAFFDICGIKYTSFEANMTEYIPDFSGKWLMEGKNNHPGLITIAGRKYQVFGAVVRTEESEGKIDFMAIAYWVDVTEYDDIKLEYEASRPSCAVIVWDNYEEVLKNVSERGRTELRGAVDDSVEQWCAGMNGISRRYDRDRYLLFFEDRHTAAIIKNKFSLLEEVRKVVSPSGVHATVSIGVGQDGRTLYETFQFAAVALEMALSRGGDQAVIKNRFNFDFYGGRGTEIETRTKVRSRVVANALYELIGSSAKVYVMGHRFSDLDAIGAAAGVCCIARKRGIPAFIVVDQEKTAAAALISRLKREAEYRNVFISPKDAIVDANNRSLLVVVDTNRPDQVESEPLLSAFSRVAVIDHHRRAASYIDNAALVFHEPYASSVCELISELLQELVEQEDILRAEAEAILSGIAMDTKNFSMRTGERTFDAAAFLRRAGADTTRVKRLLQNDLESTVARYKILQSAKLYRGIAVAAPTEPQNRIVAAQAADELLNISGVQASMVVFPIEDEGIYISARSIGEVNAQVLLEKLGGGGNASAAGALLCDIEQSAAVERLFREIDDYFDI